MALDALQRQTFGQAIAAALLETSDLSHENRTRAVEERCKQFQPPTS